MVANVPSNQTITFVTNLPAPYKLACFEEAARRSQNFRVRFESTGGPWPHWAEGLRGARFPYQVMRRGSRRWIDWLSLALNGNDFPIYGLYSTPGAAISVLLRRICGRNYAIWTSSRVTDWRNDNPVIELVKRITFKGAAVIFVPGEQAARYAESLGARAVFRTPNCIDVAALAHDLDEARVGPGDGRAHGNQIHLLYVGRLAPEKDVGCIISALAKLPRSTRERFDLRVVGEGPERERLAEAVAAAGLDGNRVFVGYKAGVDLARFYLWADVLVLPSLMEPWGLVVNEAMQAGVVPVVSSQVGCAPELIEEGRTGFVFKVGEFGSLAEVLTRIAESELSMMKAAARKHVSAFTSQAFVDGLLKGIAFAVQDAGD